MSINCQLNGGISAQSHRKGSERTLKSSNCDLQIETSFDFLNVDSPHSPRERPWVSSARLKKFADSGRSCCVFADSLRTSGLGRPIAVASSVTTRETPGFLKESGLFFLQAGTYVREEGI
jgi:hypothetical protein